MSSILNTPLTVFKIGLRDDVRAVYDSTEINGRIVIMVLQ